MAGRLSGWWRKKLASNLQRPNNEFFGWLAKIIMLRKNKHLELNAVKLCDIKPDFKVLEVGFGSGLGLQAAHSIIKNGKGKVYGIEQSFYMIDQARKRVRKGVANKKVVLFHGSASNIPLNTDSIDRVYHCNCYYFWPNMRVIMREIYRVMKPGGIMVTTLSFENIRFALKRGLLTEAQIDPVKYMTCLENYGFDGVKIKYLTDEVTGLPFQAIYAEIGEKPAHHADMLSDDEDEESDQSIISKTDSNMTKEVKPIFKSML